MKHCYCYCGEVNIPVHRALRHTEYGDDRLHRYQIATQLNTAGRFGPLHSCRHLGEMYTEKDWSCFDSFCWQTFFFFISYYSSTHLPMLTQLSQYQLINTSQTVIQQHLLLTLIHIFLSFFFMSTSCILPVSVSHRNHWFINIFTLIITPFSEGFLYTHTSDTFCRLAVR